MNNYKNWVVIKDHTIIKVCNKKWLAEAYTIDNEEYNYCKVIRLDKWEKEQEEQGSN